MSMSSAKQRLTTSTPLLSHISRRNMLSSVTVDSLGNMVSPCRIPLLMLILLLSLCSWTGIEHAKASSYIAKYPVLRTVQIALHFTSLADLFTQTPSRLLWEASSHMLQLMCESCSYTYPPLSVVRYSFIQLSELEQCIVKKLAQSFNTIRTRVLVVESPKLYP